MVCEDVSWELLSDWLSYYFFDKKPQLHMIG